MPNLSGSHALILGASVSLIASGGVWAWGEWTLNRIRTKQAALELSMFNDKNKQPNQEDENEVVNEQAEGEEPDEVKKFRLQSDRAYYEGLNRRSQLFTILSIAVACMGATIMIFEERADSIAETAEILAKRAMQEAREVAEEANSCAARIAEITNACAAKNVQEISACAAKVANANECVAKVAQEAKSCAARAAAEAKICATKVDEANAHAAKLSNELVLLARHYYAEGTYLGIGAKPEVLDALRKLNFDRMVLDKCQGSNRANFEGYLNCVKDNSSK